MAKISKDMIIADIINIDQRCIPALMEEGMHCVGCPSSQGESLEEACMVHGLDVDTVVSHLNELISR